MLLNNLNHVGLLQKGKSDTEQILPYDLPSVCVTKKIDMQVQA
jgi:hypothetical protein